MTKPQEKSDKEKPPELNQVFQGKYMRENASFFDKLFYRYPWPLLKSSLEQQIKFEQYGELPERLLIKHEEKKIEEHIKFYIKKDGQDRFAFMKGMLSANKANFIKFAFVRLCLQVDDFLVPLVMASTLDWIQSKEEESFDDTVKMIAFAMSIPLMHMLVHTIWEYFCFQMIEVGHRAHTALKVMLFRKNFKMTGATNKDFSSGEVSQIIMDESNKIWDFIWSGPDFLECPLHLITSGYFVFREVGWYGLICVLFTGLQMFKEYTQSKTEKEIGTKQREKSEKRMLYINESFNNIKSVKLYGWEPKFIKTIDAIYQEELEIGDQALLRQKFYDVLSGMLHHFMPIAVFGAYTYMGNTLTLSKMAMTSIFLDRIRGRIHHVRRLYDQYFRTMDSMQKLWEFYCAPESQTGLIKRSDDAKTGEVALKIKGNFSWGVTPKLDRADKDKIKEKLKKKAYEKRTKDMGSLRKSIFDMMPESDEKFAIPLKERTLNEVISLKDLDIEVKKGAFTVIIGETGSGKTSLLNAMIGEMIHLPDQAVKEVGDPARKIKEGELRYLEDALLQTDLTGKSPIEVKGSTGYCEQQAWIQNGKLRDNILFGLDFDKRRYVETIMSCQLESDLAIMPNGDMSEIGEKGINLSGGQKARVALARAVYKRPKVLLMDDPISALDATVRKAIFDEVFMGLMKDSTRVLVTHAVDFIHLADQIIIMKEGKITAQGSYDELIFNPYMMQVQDIHSKNKKEIQESNEIDLYDVPAFNFAKSAQASVTSKFLINLDETPSLMRKTSQICQTRAAYNKPPRSLCSAKPRSVHETESTPDYQEHMGDDDSKSKLSEKLAMTEAELDEKIVSFCGLKNELGEEISGKIGKLLVEEEDEAVNANSETFIELMKLIGGTKMCIILAATFVFNKYWEIYQQSVMNTYANTDPESQVDQQANFMKEAFFVCSFGIFFRQTQEYYIQTKKRYMGSDVVRSSLEKILMAPVNLFFDVTPLGKILQIFTEDINVLKGEILEPLKHCMNMLSHVIVVLSIIIALGSWEVYIGLSVLVYCINYCIWPYLSADNQLHKVGSTLWGPIRSYFHECMRGTTLIRAFGQEETIMARQHKMLDKTTTHFIAHHSCWCWFNLRMFYTTKIFSLLSICVIAKYRTTVDTITLTLLFNWTMDMGWFMHFFGCLNWFMRLVVRAQRVFNLQDIPQEKKTVEVVPPKNWPTQGAIKFKNVCLRYRPNTERVLKDLTFDVQPSHKIGVVGRTGAGKSTICMALTRIVELEKGSIEIDGVDISKIDIKELRDQITMIPQEPTLFTGTLRFNLDPFEEQTDERIMDLIKKAGLEYILTGTSKQEEEDKKKKEEEDKKKKEDKAYIDESEDETKESDDKSDDKAKKDEKEDDKDADDDDGKGLKFKIQEEGKNLSVGERQLICIIRAILRCNKIVILDEATANIDVVTEQAIQKLITEEFLGATVLTIAHRLNTIIKSDRVLMLNRGTVLEYGSPKELLSDPKSAFTQLTEEKKRKEKAGQSTED